MRLQRCNIFGPWWPRFFLPLALLAVIACPGANGQPRSNNAGGAPAYATVLEPKLRQLAADLLVPGAVVVVRSVALGNWSMTYGNRTLGGHDPVGLGDHVRIGSNTKTWTGTVILQLVQEGQLRLDAPISQYLDDVPNGLNITITQLLNMRSGLYNYSESLELNQSLDDNPQKVWTPDELLAIAYKHPPYFAPDAGYKYSNTNIVLLGKLIERLTGNAVEQEFQRRIFAPLGLQNSELPPRTSTALPGPYPHGYQYGTNVETLESAVLPEDRQAQARAGMLQPHDVTNVNPSWGWTAGAGISNAADLARYVEALGGGGLLSEAMQQQRLASIQPTDPANPQSPGYGLGIAKMGPMYGHTGELPGYNSFMGHDPDRKITVITWTSLNAAPDGKAPAVEMAKAIIAQLYGSATGAESPSASHP